MKIAVIGSRSITDLNSVKHIFERFLTKDSQVVSGGARGVDTLVRDYMKSVYGKEVQEILPDYKRYGKAAPMIRNKLIIDAADFVLAIQQRHSSGTQHAVDYAIKQNKSVVLYEFETMKPKVYDPVNEL